MPFEIDISLPASPYFERDVPPSGGVPRDRVPPHTPPLHQTIVRLLTKQRRSGTTPWGAFSTSASRSFRPL